MNSKINVLDQIISHPVIPVYYNDNSITCLNIMSACYDGGIRVFEFTNRGEKALENFKLMQKKRDAEYPDLLLGIGTIKTSDQAKTYIDLNADFIVSPIVNRELAEVTKQHGVFWIPGCMTPSEIALAEELGATLVKLFPGDVLGISFLKAIKPLFPNLKFMPTGGVDISGGNITGWLQAGVTALGFGSKLFSPPSKISNGNWLTERCRQIGDIVMSGI
ncbi:bifunctional 4-hydroxy-2-oxoglutarate aldolase/2-dehydro-3-deoxy-phosphogluconate aldolase [Pedobacter sp. JCM 36344]|uniref:bifunctional 4-hydroxy-2-oxoglutarate aldolase/2-dehydro-3-deoxy-phosphogluconate aldolase n=1 Tax=Pedobacter sp. JCM 36344 TaxID=3374280 RepID=UPI00397BB7E8